MADDTCDFCREGLQTSCRHGGAWGAEHVDGGQGEAARVPQADSTLVKLPVGEDDALMPSLLTLSDVFSTGHHAAVSARVQKGGTVAVIGDGAVGLCGVLAAKRPGAEGIILLGRHTSRTELGREFGATDVVAERGEEGVEAVRKLTGGDGVHSVLECVGMFDALETGLGIVRAGGTIGRVGVPQYQDVPMGSGPVRGERDAQRRDRPRHAPTSRSCCPTSSRGGSSPARSSTAPSTSTACRTATAR